MRTSLLNKVGGLTRSAHGRQSHRRNGVSHLPLLLAICGYDLTQALASIHNRICDTSGPSIWRDLGAYFPEAQP